MTGYPPRHPQNGPRRLVLGLGERADGWPGDYLTDSQGNVWIVDRNGDWQCLPATRRGSGFGTAGDSNGKDCKGS